MFGRFCSIRSLGFSSGDLWAVSSRGGRRCTMGTLISLSSFARMNWIYYMNLKGLAPPPLKTDNHLKDTKQPSTHKTKTNISFIYTGPPHKPTHPRIQTPPYTTKKNLKLFSTISLAFYHTSSLSLNLHPETPQSCQAALHILYLHHTTRGLSRTAITQHQG